MEYLLSSLDIKILWSTDKVMVVISRWLLWGYVTELDTKDNVL